MKIHDIEKELEKVGDSVALGYEGMLDFNYGYLYALFKHKVITRDEYNKLKKVHSNYRNGNCRWSIGKDGEISTDEEADISE